MSRPSSGSGSVPEEMYDDEERREVAVDSPISAADMLSRAVRQKRREMTRRSSGTHFASPSTVLTPNKSTKRLFPDTPEVRKLGLTPTSRNHSQRKSKRARKSQYDDEDDDDAGIDDTTIHHQDRFNAPVASTPYPAQRKQPASNQASITSQKGGPSRRTSAGSAMRDSRMQQPSSSQYFDSSSSGQKREKPGWFAGWGTGKEESPMDILRKLAAAPGSVLSTPSSILERFLGNSKPQTSQRDDMLDGRSQKAAESSSIGPTPSISSRNQRPSANLQQRRSMANTSAAISELGQGRRLDPRQSRVSTNLFANLGSPASDFNDITVPEKSFVTHLADLEDRETELQRILAERTATEGFALPRSSNRTRQSMNMFNNLLEEDDESLAIDDKTLTPIPNDFGQGEMQYEDIPYEEEDIPLPRRQGSESFADDEPQSGQEELEEESPMRIPRGGYEELYSLDGDSDSDTDSQEDQLSSSEEDYDIDDDQSKTVGQSSLPKKRSVKTKEVVRTSRLTGKPVKSMSSTFVKELFRQMVTPNISVGAIPGPSKPSSKARQKRVALDKEVVKAVEDMTHEFFVALADSLQNHEYGDDSYQHITAKIMVGLMKGKGILDSQQSLVSLARKMLPRELSDQLAPNLDKGSDEDSDGGKYGMGNISAAVFNQENFSSSVSDFSRSASSGAESDSDYRDGKEDRLGAVELLAYQEATTRGNPRSSQLQQHDRNRDSSSLLSQDTPPRSRQPSRNRRRSSKRR